MRAGGRRGLGWSFDIVTGTLLGVVVWTLYDRTLSELVALSTRPEVLWAICIGAAALAVAWPLTIVLNWLVVRPPDLVRERSVGSSIFVGVLCLAVATPLLVTSRYAYVQHDLLSNLFGDGNGRSGGGLGGQGANPWAGRDRIGVLLLGGDAGPDRDGLRTDTVMLASIEPQTGETVLFNLPRNLEEAPFPPGELRDAFPDGYPGLLYALYRTVEEDRPDLLRGRRDRGVTALKQTVQEILGVPVDYYMLVDLKGFRELVDALDGVRVNVKKRISYGGIRVTGSIGEPKGWIEAGTHKMDGLTALRYARSRDNSSDYDRISRQRCVLNAILDQADPLTVLRRYERLASVAKDNIRTDVPQDMLPAFINLSERVKNTRVRSVAFVPPLISTGNPDYDLIRKKAREAIAPPQKAAAASAGNNEQSAPAPQATRTAPPAGAASPGRAKATGAAEDLDSVC
jgi:polyisoprenyl-teichoic acid--peptidoglycan teichoic acid transferase